MKKRDIPLIVTEEAALRVADLGAGRDLEVMLDWVRSNVSGLEAIRVAPGHAGRPHPGDLTVIWAHRKPAHEPASRGLTEWDFCGWKAQTFRPTVGSRFVLACTSQPLPPRSSGKV